MSVDVLLALEGELEASVAALVDAEPNAHLSRRCADLAEAVAAAEAGLGTVLIATEAAPLDRRLVARLAKRGIAVVAVAGDSGGAERLAGRGGAAVLPPTVTADEVVAVALTATVAAAPAATTSEDPGSESEADAPAAKRGAIVAVWGPQGAPGRSSVAANVARELVDVGEVLLVDADTWGAAQATSLGLADEAPGMAAVARSALSGELTSAVLERYAVEIGEGLRLVTGLSRADRWAELAPAALDALWPVVREVAEVTVVDCGSGVAEHDAAGLGGAPSREEATAGILAAADLVVVVGSAEPLGMQRLVHALADLATAAPAADTPRLVVVNRVRASVAGDRPREAVADVLAQYAQVSEVFAVPFDLAAFDAAALHGGTLAECAPRSAGRRALRDLARLVAAHPALGGVFDKEVGAAESAA